MLAEGVVQAETPPMKKRTARPKQKATIRMEHLDITPDKTELPNEAPGPSPHEAKHDQGPTPCETKPLSRKPGNLREVSAPYLFLGT